MRKLSLLALCLVVCAGCNSARSQADFARARRLTHGDPARGRQTIRAYGCQNCHTIPGVLGGNGLVGPSLARVGSRMYLAGELPNTPANMMSWIQHPHGVEQHTVMPEMNVTPDDSRDITAYLYTLR